MFTPIDLAQWPRGQMFYYFSHMAPTGYSLTVSLDVTALHRTVKERGVKFFPAYVWLVTKNLNRQVEFRCAVQDGQLGYFDTLTPLYAAMHPVSCLPRVAFRHFAVHSYENKPYYFPSVEAGKFEERDGRLIMPLSLTCHHATTDGWHVSRFLEDLQREMDHFDQYL